MMNFSDAIDPAVNNDCPSREPSASDPHGGLDWRQVYRLSHEQARVGCVLQKTWSGLTVVLKETFWNSPLNLHCVNSYARVNIVLEQAGGELRLQTHPRHAGHTIEGAGAMYYVPAETEIWAISEDLRFMRNLRLQFTQETLAYLAPDDVTLQLPEVPHFNLAEPRLLALGRLFAAEVQREGPGDRLLGDSLSIGLLALLSRHVGPKQGKMFSGGLTARQLKCATEYLRAHIANSPNGPDLARTTGLSISHFHRAFKASTGLAPHAWLTAVRIQRGRELLRETSRTLADIAMATGFSDQSHFTRVFLRHVGTSPGAWRQEMLV